MKLLENNVPLIERGGSNTKPTGTGLLTPGAELALAMPPQAFVSDLANELAIARSIQESLLPKQFPEAPGFGLAAFCQSAREVGGDFYDAMSLGDDCVLLVVADVMGKGVPAALVAASLRMLVRLMAERHMSPSELLARINMQMYAELSSVDMFITAQLAVADIKRGVLQVASAGHCPLLLADEAGESHIIAPEGLPLGIQANATFAEETVPLDTCSCALLYTDGLTEACDASGNLFGLERLESWLLGAAPLSRTAAQLKDEFLIEFHSFQQQAATRDDLTLLVLAKEKESCLASLGHAKVELV
jgi:serine phosphatase RsbU (regulator of sigma subunit)